MCRVEYGVGNEYHKGIGNYLVRMKSVKAYVEEKLSESLS